MTAAVADLVHMTSTTTSTGNLTATAVNGRRTFGDVFGTGGTTHVFKYFISNRDAAEWERGEGHMSDATTFVRDKIWAGSNGTSAVNFSAGTKDITCDIPAAEQLSTDALDMMLAPLAMNQADILNAAQFLGPAGNIVADSFDALTYVNTGAATNLDTGTAGLLKPTSTVQTQISTAGKTKIGTLTAGGGVAAAFDGTTSQVISASAITTGSGNLSGTVGVDWGSGVTKTVTRFDIYAPSDNYGFSNNADGLTFNYLLEGSQDNSAWTTLYSSSVVGHPGTIVSITSGITTSTAYRYHRLAITETGTPGGGHSMGVAELRLYEGVDAVNNVTVRSTGLTAAAAPSTMKLVALVNHAVSAVAGTDYKFKASRDGGSNLSGYLTLTDRFTIPGGTVHVIESDAIDVTGITTGTTPCWQWETFNGKAVELLAIYLRWN